MNELKKYLLRKEAAEYIQRLGLPIRYKTLAKYASIGGGPEMRRFGRRVCYEPAKLLEWVESRLSPSRRSTSELDGLSPDAPTRSRRSKGQTTP